MIEIADWVIIAIVGAAFASLIAYSIYFKISATRFPKVIEFNSKIDPNQTVTILAIEGKGIIKKISAQITENSDSIIDLTLDQTSYFVVEVPKGQGGIKSSPNDQDSLKFDVKLDACYYKGFSLSINNRSTGILNAIGKINYEIKKPPQATIRGLYKDFTGDKPLINQA